MEFRHRLVGCETVSAFARWASLLMPGQLAETAVATVEVDEIVDDALGSGADWDVVSAFGELKGGRGDWLVEKCAELGARALVPLRPRHVVEAATLQQT